MLTAKILHCSGSNLESCNGLKRALEKRGFEADIVSVTDMYKWARTGDVKAKLMVVPGGHTSKIFSDIALHTGDAKLKWMKRFVQTGGSYLGVCAGANLGSSDLSYQYYDLAPYTPAKRFEMKGLGLLPVKTQGPVAGMGNHFSKTENVVNPSMKDAVQAEVTTKENGSKTCYYLYGSALRILDHEQVEILARYKNAEPAVIQRISDEAEGKVVLTCIHAEYEPQDVEKEETPDQTQSRNELMDLILAPFLPIQRLSNETKITDQAEDLDQTTPAVA